MTNEVTIEERAAVAKRMRQVLLSFGIEENQLSAMMDLDYINDIIPLDFDRLQNCDNNTFLHDVIGIRNNWNRQTKQMDNCFLPKCAKGQGWRIRNDYLRAGLIN